MKTTQTVVTVREIDVECNWCGAVMPGDVPAPGWIEVGRTCGCECIWLCPDDPECQSETGGMLPGRSTTCDWCAR